MWGTSDARCGSQALTGEFEKLYRTSDGRGGGPPRQSPAHARRRQGVRCGRVCRRPAGVQRDAACGAEHHAPPVGGRRSDARHPGYAVRGRVRKRIEEVFGWTKAAAGFRKTHHRDLACVGWMFTLTATAYNLVRLPKLVGDAAQPCRGSARAWRKSAKSTPKFTWKVVLDNHSATPAR
jgi:hypothetical protein